MDSSECLDIINDTELLLISKKDKLGKLFSFVVIIFFCKINFSQGQMTLQEARDCWRGAKQYFFLHGTTPSDSASIDCLTKSVDFYQLEQEKYPLEFGEMLYYCAHQAMILRKPAEVERLTIMGINILEEQPETFSVDSLLGDLHGLKAQLYSNLLFEYDRAVTEGEISYLYYEKANNVHGRIQQQLNLAITKAHFGFCSDAKVELESVEQEINKLNYLEKIVYQSTVKSISGRIKFCEGSRLIGVKRFEEFLDTMGKARAIFKGIIPILNFIGHRPSIVANYYNIGIAFIIGRQPTLAELDSASYYFGKGLEINRGDANVDLSKLIFLDTYIEQLRHGTSSEKIEQLDDMFNAFGMVSGQADRLSSFETAPQSGIQTVQTLEILSFKISLQNVQFAKTQDVFYLKKSIEDCDLFVQTSTCSPHNQC